MRILYIILSVIFLSLIIFNITNQKFMNKDTEIHTVFRIDSKEVDQKTYNNAKEKLTISEDMAYSSSIEQSPDDPAAYPAGSEVGYNAVDKVTGKKYRYIILTYPKSIVHEIVELEQNENQIALETTKVAQFNKLILDLESSKLDMNNVSKILGVNFKQDTYANNVFLADKDTSDFKNIYISKILNTTTDNKSYRLHLELNESNSNLTKENIVEYYKNNVQSSLIASPRANPLVVSYVYMGKDVSIFFIFNDDNKLLREIEISNYFEPIIMTGDYNEIRFRFALQFIDDIPKYPIINNYRVVIDGEEYIRETMSDNTGGHTYPEEYIKVKSGKHNIIIELLDKKLKKEINIDITKNIGLYVYYDKGTNQVIADEFDSDKKFILE